MASILEGFLVRLGFDVDKEQQAKFKGALEAGSKRVQQFAKYAGAVGLAFAGSVALATRNIAKMSNFATMNRASVAGVSALSLAFEGVGGSAQEAQGAIANLSGKLKSMPQMAQYLKSQYGVETFDKNGKQRDTVAIMMDLRKQLSKLPEAEARARASVLGLDGAFDSLMSKDFPSQFSRASKAQSAWGSSLNKNAKDVSGLWTEIDYLSGNLKNGFYAVVADLNKQAGLTDMLKTLNKNLPSITKTFIDWSHETVGGIVDTFKGAYDSVAGFFDGIKSFFVNIFDAKKEAEKDADGSVLKTALNATQAKDYYLQAKEKNGGTLTDDEQKQLTAFKNRKALSQEDVNKNIVSQNARLGFDSVGSDDYSLTEEDVVSKAVHAKPIVAKTEAVPFNAYSPQQAKADAVRTAPTNNTMNDNAVTVNTTVNIIGSATPETARQIGREASEASRKFLSKRAVSPVGA